MRARALLLLFTLAAVCNCRFDYDTYWRDAASGGQASSLAGTMSTLTGTGRAGSAGAASQGGVGTVPADTTTLAGGATGTTYPGTASGGAATSGGANSLGGASFAVTGGAVASGGESRGGASTAVDSGGAPMNGGASSSGGASFALTGGAVASGGISAGGVAQTSGGLSTVADTGGTVANGGESSFGGASVAGRSGGTTSGNGGSSGASDATGGTGQAGTGGSISTNTFVVTTSTDEGDANATPVSPGGTGFSLREAITYANQTSGQQTIQIPTGYNIALGSMLPALTDASGTVILGQGAVLNGSGASSVNPCLRISSDNNRVTGLEIAGCRRAPIDIDSGQNNQLDSLDVHDNDRPISVSAANNRVGPGNIIAGNGTNGLSLGAPNVLVDQNRIMDNVNIGVLMLSTSDGARLIGNILARNAVGFEINTACNDVVIYHNVIDGNTSRGGTISTTVTGTDFQANLITSNGGPGVSSFDAAYGVRDYNDWWNNAGTACSGCAALGSHDLTVDPMYVDAVAGDFHLMSASPVRDAAPDLGVDTNGTDSGNCWALPPMGPFDVP